MPIFEGEELVDVTTPDGRNVKLPLSVARSLQALSFQPMTPQAPATPEIEMPAVDVASWGQQATSPQFGIPEPLANIPTGGLQPIDTLPTQNTPDYQAGTLDVPALAKQQKQAEAQTKKRAAAQAAYAATPAGQRDAYATDQVEAKQDVAKATVGAADIEAAGLYELRNNKRRYDEKIAGREADVGKEMAARDTAIKSKLAAMEDTRKKIEDTRIDRSIDHPVIVGIGLLLSSIGSSMGGTQDNGIKTLYAALDRKVEGQIVDLEQKNKLYGFQKSEVEEFKKLWTDKIAMKQWLLGAEASRAARQAEIIGLESSSERVKAQSKVAAAQIYSDAEALKAAAKEKQLESDENLLKHRQTIGLGYANLTESKRQYNETMLYNRDKLAAENLAAMAAANAKGGEKAMEAYSKAQDEVQKRGVYSIGSDEQLLTKEGQAAMDVAAQMDAEAQKLRSGTIGPLSEEASARIDTLQRQANEMRGNARVFGAVLFETPELAAKFKDTKYVPSQGIARAVEKIKALYKEHGRTLWNKQGPQAAMDTLLGTLELQLKQAYGLGAYDKGSAAKLKELVGRDITATEDPGNIAHALGIRFKDNPEAFKSRLDVLVNTLDEEIRDVLAVRHYSGKNVLFSKQEEPDLKAETGAKTQATPAENVKDVESRGWLRRNVFDAPVNAAGAVKSAVTGDSYESVQARGGRLASESGSARYPYLSPKQGEAFELWTRALVVGDKDAIGKAKEKLAGAVSSGTDEARLAWLRTIRENAPDLYPNYKDKLAKGKAAEQLTFEDNLRAQQPARAKSDIKTPLVEVAKRAVTSAAAFAELAERVKADEPGAREAYRAVDAQRMLVQGLR